MAEEIRRQYMAKVFTLEAKELRFVESVIGRLRDEQRVLSLKQCKWLYDIARTKRIL